MPNQSTLISALIRSNQGMAVRKERIGRKNGKDIFRFIFAVVTQKRKILILNGRTGGIRKMLAVENLVKGWEPVLIDVPQRWRLELDLHDVAENELDRDRLREDHRKALAVKSKSMTLARNKLLPRYRCQVCGGAIALRADGRELRRHFDRREKQKIWCPGSGSFIQFNGKDFSKKESITPDPLLASPE